MRFRKLRIAWSVGWGVLCLLAIVFWIRSYHRVDLLIWKLANTVELHARSLSGALSVSYFDDPDVALGTPRYFRLGSVP
jgi:hypothetical protein